jgi:hypothetical protein
MWWFQLFGYVLAGLMLFAAVVNTRHTSEPVKQDILDGFLIWSAFIFAAVTYWLTK